MIVTFDMNPKFTEVTLNSFVMNGSCTNPAKKLEIIDITNEASSCLLPLALVRRRKRTYFLANNNIICN